MNHERRVGILILLAASVAIIVMLYPLTGLPVVADPGTEVLDDTLER